MSLKDSLILRIYRENYYDSVPFQFFIFCYPYSDLFLYAKTFSSSEKINTFFTLCLFYDKKLVNLIKMGMQSFPRLYSQRYQKFEIFESRNLWSCLTLRSIRVRQCHIFFFKINSDWILFFLPEIYQNL